MRRVALLLLLFVAPASRAQTDADRALIERTLDALRIGLQMNMVARTFAEQPEGGIVVDADSLAADVRARFADGVRADPRPALLREALPYLESEAYTRSVELSVASQTPEGLEAFFAAVADPEPGVLSDSALAVRFIGATEGYLSVRETRRRGFLAIVTEVPSFVEARARVGYTPDEMVALMLGPEDAFYEGFLLGVRYQIQRQPMADVQAHIAFGESAAGRYVNGIMREAVIGAMVPLMVRSARRMASAPPQEVPPPPPHNGPPPPPGRMPALESLPPDVPAVFDVVEQEPVLIGGLEGLAARIVYPEAARRESVEGTAYVQFVVDETGAVVDAVVTRSPDERLSAAALDVVRGARFEPGRHRGDPVKVRYVLPIRFALRDDDAPDDD